MIRAMLRARCTRGSACGHALEQAARQAGDIAVQFEFEQACLQHVRRDAGAGHQRIQAHRIEAQRRQQRVLMLLRFVILRCLV